MNNFNAIDIQDVTHKNHRNVTLHIERLVLDGFAYSLHERGLLQVALQQELRSLVDRGGLANLTGEGMTPALNAEAIPVSATTRPAQVGTMVANSVFNSLSQKF
jgi:hypothetical protein